MLVHEQASNPPTLPTDWHARWEGPDRGLIAAWARGLEKRKEAPDIAAAAAAGELPVLAWRGGVDKPIKGEKAGTLLYLATWHGLRGDDLQLDTDAEIRLRCARHGVTVLFSSQIPAEDPDDTP